MSATPSTFTLIVSADAANRAAELRLLDAHGAQLAYQRADFGAMPASRRQALFDLRDYVRHYVEPARQAEAVAEVGVRIAREVLGDAIFGALARSAAQRTLCVQLPYAAGDGDQLVAALARVPWEIARAAPDQPALSERNLLVRVVHGAEPPAAVPPVSLGADESLRLLFVFAEARGTRPLAARRERRELRRFLEQEVYPRRRVQADFLTHGVTRERLEAQIADRGGYHVVHWSGHGSLNRLELATDDGAGEPLAGDALVDLFTRAGGFIPHLFFLSACHSGDALRVESWGDFLAVAQGQAPGTAALGAAALGEPAPDGAAPGGPPGYTGTAHALLRGGVPSVVAMRYAVTDEYARDLGVEFYRALLAHTQPKSAAAALTAARRQLLDARKHHPARYHVCDHATPVLYGAEQPGLVLPPGRSPGLDRRDPRLHQIAELTTAGHAHFVGRTWELAGLGAEFFGDDAAADVRPAALVTGLGGMGKTALAAEALALWEPRFAWVLLYQAKPNALGLEATLRDVHVRLAGEEGQRYYRHVQQYPADAVWREARDGFTGAERLRRLARNLARAMRDEAILLVLDNFETNLVPEAAPAFGDGEPAWACQDPAWDACLALLASELAGTPSRVLVTCRRPIAALAGAACHHVRLGPLPAGEAALYLREHAALSRMVFGAAPSERALATRLLAASRFHPLLMDRLARLATGGAELRPQLMEAIETLERSGGAADLPALFADARGDTRELAYLQDALATSIDQLIAAAGADARRLLWVVALANDPVTLDLLAGVWGAGLTPGDGVSRPDAPGLVRRLAAVGLLTEERTGPDDANPDLGCHELVRERVRAWIDAHPEDRASLTEHGVRLAYAERLAAVFAEFQGRDLATAFAAGSRALIYCVQAGAYDRLQHFASGVVTSVRDPRLMADLIPHLEAAAAAAPDGVLRWQCVGYLANALSSVGEYATSLPLFEQAATAALAAAQGGGGPEVWTVVAWLTGNWAVPLLMTGDLAAARQRQQDSADAERRAGRPAINAVGSELEALRLDLLQGRYAEALPQLETHLAQIERWWQQHRAGRPAPEAPDLVGLARVYIAALDIAAAACATRDAWALALRYREAILAIKRELHRPAEDVAIDRVDRADALARLGRPGEARAELEACLDIFADLPIHHARVLASLADLSDAAGDAAEAVVQQRRALAVHEQLPGIGNRAVSHFNLARYLRRLDAAPADAESARHRMASLVYLLGQEVADRVTAVLRSYDELFREASAAGTVLHVPRVAELLADPAFRPLDAWLRQRGAAAADVQAAVDDALAQAQQATPAHPSPAHAP